MIPAFGSIDKLGQNKDGKETTAGDPAVVSVVSCATGNLKSFYPWELSSWLLSTLVCSKVATNRHVKMAETIKQAISAEANPPNRCVSYPSACLTISEPTRETTMVFNAMMILIIRMLEARASAVVVVFVLLFWLLFMMICS